MVAGGGLVPGLGGLAAGVRSAAPPPPPPPFASLHPPALSLPLSTPTCAHPQARAHEANGTQRTFGAPPAARRSRGGRPVGRTGNRSAGDWAVGHWLTGGAGGAAEAAGAGSLQNPPLKITQAPPPLLPPSPPPPAVPSPSRRPLPRRSSLRALLHLFRFTLPHDVWVRANSTTLRVGWFNDDTQAWHRHRHWHRHWHWHWPRHGTGPGMALAQAWHWPRLGTGQGMAQAWHWPAWR